MLGPTCCLRPSSVNELRRLEVPPLDCAVCRACGHNELRGMVLNGCDGILMLELMQQLAGCQVPYLYIHYM